MGTSSSAKKRITRRDALPSYTRNIQGRAVELTLEEADPEKVRLDADNPRLRYSVLQLADGERTDEACTLLLTSQEETESLKRSILLSGGVQEPIYVRSDGRVAEGNRRVVAVRALRDEYPKDRRFSTIPAWRIPADVPESTIADLQNEIHLGSVRGWAPYEKACQMRALVDRGGLIEEEVAERYRMTAREVKQHIAAVNSLDTLYFPITDDPTDPNHRSKFSYFLEFHKNGRILRHGETTKDLAQRFARWVRDQKIDTGAKVRRLPKILDSREATRLLEASGFQAAEEFLQQQNPLERELYGLVEQARIRLSKMTMDEFYELRDSDELKGILEALRDEVSAKLSEAARRPRR
jgi:hypothetical protein